MDAPPPPPPPNPPAYVYAASDTHPITDQERKLCKRASSTDWLYLGGAFAADIGSVALDGQVFKFNQHRAIRTIGPGLVGLTWGFTLGAIYPALPKCDANWITYAPPEGDIRSSLPYALSMAIVAGITAPVLVGVETGPLPDNWPTSERATRVILAGVTGFAGALLPYWTVISPRTWRASRELAKLRAWGDSQGAYVGYGFRF